MLCDGLRCGTTGAAASAASDLRGDRSGTDDIRLIERGGEGTAKKSFSSSLFGIVVGESLTEDASVRVSLDLFEAPLDSDSSPELRGSSEDADTYR